MSVNGTSECANIDIPQDQALEGDHDFTVQLSTLSPDLVIIGSPEAAEIIIADGDSKCVVSVPMSCVLLFFHVSHMTLYVCAYTTSKDATLTLTPTEFTVDEGPNPDLAELCVVISNLPAGGLQCDLVATLTPLGSTAGK